MINIPKLKGKIVEKGMSIKELAKEINVESSTLYRRMSNNGQTLTIKNVEAIAKALQLSYSDLQEIFFGGYVA